jgi:hypothetical protein
VLHARISAHRQPRRAPRRRTYYRRLPYRGSRALQTTTAERTAAEYVANLSSAHMYPLPKSSAGGGTLFVSSSGKPTNTCGRILAPFVQITLILLPVSELLYYQEPTAGLPHLRAQTPKPKPLHLSQLCYALPRSSPQLTVSFRTALSFIAPRCEVWLISPPTHLYFHPAQYLLLR